MYQLIMINPGKEIQGESHQEVILLEEIRIQNLRVL